MPKPFHLPADLEIVALRHAHSKLQQGVANPREHGDLNIGLTERGVSDARELGARNGDLMLGSLIVVSPALRTRETLEAMREGAKLLARQLHIVEDIRTRELDYGCGTSEQLRDLKSVHGCLTRLPSGESAADVFARVSSLMQDTIQWAASAECSTVLFVSHGFTIRVLDWYLNGLTVEQFEQLQNPSPGEIRRLV